MSKLQKFIDFKNGKKRPNNCGIYPVYGGNGVLDYADSYNMSNCVIIGRVGVYCGNVYLSKNKCWVSDNAISATAKDGLDTYYMYYLLKSLNLNKRQIGTSQPLLTQAILNNIDSEIPEINIQTKIGQVLKSIEAKIEANERINNNLQQQATAIFDKLTFDKQENGTLGQILIENQKSTIKVSDAREVIGSYPFFTSGKAVLSFETFIVDGRNIYLNTGGNADVKYYIGKAAYSTDTWSIRGTGQYTDYLHLLLLSSIEELDKIYFEGSALRHLQKKKLLTKRIYIPTEEEVNSFNKIIVPIFDRINSNIRESHLLANIRDTLLPKLMSGEIDVSNVEI